jgi:nuclear transport factor 2 (NTF2) superfamily protein
MTTDESRPPFPLFTAETAQKKITDPEDTWNARDPLRVSPAPDNGAAPGMVSIMTADRPS